MDLEWYEHLTAYANLMYQEELGRDVDRTGLAFVLYQAREQGWQDEDFKAWIRQSTEYRTRWRLELQQGRFWSYHGRLVVPVYCHAGDLLALYYRSPEQAETALDEIAQAGYLGVRTWTVLAQDFWQHLGRQLTPQMPRYWSAVEGFAVALIRRGLQWIVSNGDLMWYYRDAARRDMFLANLGSALREVEARRMARVVVSVDAGNEAWQNGEPEPKALYDALGSFFLTYGSPTLFALTSERNEAMGRYAGNITDIHLDRAGDPRDWIRAVRRLTPPVLQSEPPGPGRLVSAIDEQVKSHLTWRHLTALAAAAWLHGDAWVYHSSPGVSYQVAGEFAQQPGFASVPRLAASLPHDLQTWTRQGEGVTNGRITLVVPVDVIEAPADAIVDVWQEEAWKPFEGTRLSFPGVYRYETLRR